MHSRVNKRIVLTALLASMAFVSTDAMAYSLGDFFRGAPNDIKAANTGAYIGIGKTNFNYKEIAGKNMPVPPGGTLDAENGKIKSYLIGINGQFSYVYWALNMNYASGDTAYTGGYTTSSGQSGTLDTTDHQKKLSYNLELGPTISPEKHIALTPLAEIGMRVWDRKLSGGTGSGGVQVSGYSEAYLNTWTAFGGKIDLAYGPVDLSLVDLDGKTHHGNMTTGNMGFSLGDHSWKQQRVRLVYTFDKWIGLFASYQHTKFGYGASKYNSQGYMEPNSLTDNHSYYVGVKLG